MVLSPKSNQEGYHVQSYRSTTSEIDILKRLLFGPEPDSWTCNLKSLSKFKGTNHFVSSMGQSDSVILEKDLVHNLILHLFVAWTTSAQKAWLDHHNTNREISWLESQFLPSINNHVYDYMLSKFGVVALAESVLRAMSQTVCEGALEGSKRCYVFARLCGLDPSAYTPVDAQSQIPVKSVVEGNKAQGLLCKWVATAMCQLWWKMDCMQVEEPSGKVFVSRSAARGIIAAQIELCNADVQANILSSFDDEVAAVKSDRGDDLADIDDVLYAAVSAWDCQVDALAFTITELYQARGLTKHMISYNEFSVALKHSISTLLNQPIGKVTLPDDVTMSCLYREVMVSSKLSDHITADAFAGLLCSFGWLSPGVPEEVQTKLCKISLENAKVVYSYHELDLLQGVWKTLKNPLQDATKLSFVTPEEVESFARLLLQQAMSSPIWQLFRRVVNKWWLNSCKEH